MIFRCFWYDEDGYGPVDGISVIVQADTDTDATHKAINYINKRYPCAGKGYNFDKYGKYECTNLTDIEIIHLSHISGGLPS